MSDIDALLKLGDVDRRLIDARRRRAQAVGLAVTQEARVAEAQRALDGFRDKTKAAVLETKRLEADVKAKQAEIDKTTGNLNTCKNNDDYKMLLKSIETRKAELGDLEMKVLEAYEATDKRGADEKELQARKKLLDGELASAKGRSAEATTKVDKELAELGAERKAAVAGANPEHVALYERVLEAQKGQPAIAAVVKDMCQGCFIKIRPEQVSLIRGGKSVETCFNCQRILFHQA